MIVERRSNKMSDNQDSNDEIQSISQRLQMVTAIENPQNVTRLMNQSSLTTENSVIATAQQPGTRNEIKNINRLELDNNERMRNLPELDLPEKIILIIDLTREKDCTEFKLGTGAKYMPMFMIKRVIEIFVGAKSMIKPNHEFAIMTLHPNSIKWVCDFTSNIKTVLNTVDSLTEEELDEEKTSFDLNQLFEMIYTHVSLPNNTDYNDPTNYITRAILIYSRSNCIPRFQSGQKYFKLLSENPYFILDCLFVHEPPCGSNQCEEVYKELINLDANNLSYILEVGRNATKLHNNVAKLLAHPLQRPLQRNTCYAICSSGATEEIQTNV